MSTPRFFCPPASLFAADDLWRLPAHVAHHATRVLRLGIGASLTLFDGVGNECSGVIVRIEAEVWTRLMPWTALSRESPLAVTLLQTLQAADKMDLTIQKAVELGVAAIQPLFGRRSVTKLAGERQRKREAHWQAVAVAACEQCGRNVVPRVAPIVALENWLSQHGPSLPGAKLMLSPTASDRLADLPPASSAWLLIGAEGGFAPEEIAAAASAGFHAVRLGPRILRTETAGLATLAALETLWGDF